MTRPLPPVEVELGEDLQNAVLGFLVPMPDGPPMTVGALLAQARSALDAANTALRDSPLVAVAATHIMQSEKRRGHPTIQVSLDGKTYLRVTYDNGEARPAPALASKSKLPKLSSLRTRAEQLGVNVSHLGRNKHKIIALLKEVEARQGQAAPAS